MGEPGKPDSLSSDRRDMGSRVSLEEYIERHAKVLVTKETLLQDIHADSNLKALSTVEAKSVIVGRNVDNSFHQRGIYDMVYVNDIGDFVHVDLNISEITEFISVSDKLFKAGATVTDSETDDTYRERIDKLNREISQILKEENYKVVGVDVNSYNSWHLVLDQKNDDS
ncbi:MAG: hypothetical protein HYV41_01615 [Candidatus Magasanikbacteria bacterium]|nr:hypothetical protein [Candidatus Magasanikbacteria bacterium]